MDFNKQQILQVKADIKKLVSKQKSTKLQRKESFSGERTMPAWEAAYKHSNNRYTLRHMYIAYGFMRGKSIEQIEDKRKSEYSERVVNSIMEDYAKIVCNNQG